jgi:hypothetical protein
MRFAATFALAALALVACATGAAGTSETTSLTVTYWPKGQNAGQETFTVHCGPARGTVPRPAVACRRLALGGTKLLKPVPATAICTQIYGGPQIARIAGRIDGKRVWATFNRTNGCQISRWDGLSPWLLPRGGVRPISG